MPIKVRPFESKSTIWLLIKVCNQYEYKRSQLLLLMNFSLIYPNQHSLEAALMLRKVLKMYDLTRSYTCKEGEGYHWGRWLWIIALTDPRILQRWFDDLTAILANLLTGYDTGLDLSAHQKKVGKHKSRTSWKGKKWCSHIISQLFSRYVIPVYDLEEMKEFARQFSANLAPQFLGPVFKILKLQPSSWLCKDRVIHLCLTF